MRRGGRVLVLLGIVLGIVTAGGVYFLLMTAQPLSPRAPTKQVIIAQQNIAARDEILPEALGRGEWPEAYVPVGAYEKASDISGKLAVDAIYQGQIILPQMLIDKSRVKETRSNASFVIPEGKVAIAFPITSLSGVAGAIQHGDMVDLLMSVSTAGKVITGTTTAATTDGSISQIMLQDVLVLNVGLWPTGAPQDKQAAPASFLTFALTPQDALSLKSAREQGTIELILRRAGDHQQFKTEPVTLPYLIKRFNFLAPPR